MVRVYVAVLPALPADGGDAVICVWARLSRRCTWFQQLEPGLVWTAIHAALHPFGL